MPIIAPKPNRYESISDYLFALGFSVNKDFFICGAIQFPISAIAGHTVVSFAAKMREHGWMPTETTISVLWPR